MAKKRNYVPGLIGLAAILVALWQTFLAGGSRSNEEPELGAPVQGRNDTVLLAFSGEHGLSNVHVATTFSLLKNHPGVEVHVASFPRCRNEVNKVMAAAGRLLTFHTLQGRNYIGSLEAQGMSLASITNPPGRKGNARMCHDMQVFLSPWTGPDHLSLYRQLRTIIDDVDPAVVVLSPLFRPAIDATRAANRLHAIISPNSISDVFGGLQPWGQFFWKYPVIGSGFDFPVPWRDVPENVYLAAQFIYSMVAMPRIADLRAFLREHGGIEKPIDMFGLRRDDVPWISQEMEGAALPVSYVPRNVTAVGPIVISSGPAEEQDPELAAWLAKGPTVLVNLGGSVRYYMDQARVMAESLRVVLDKAPDVQVLWKFNKAPGAEYDDSVYRTPLATHLESGRLRLAKWLIADPTAILETGHVVASVHHGGANVYHEAILTGVPQVVLPLWVDLYNYAALAEQIGVGVWASRRTAPDWSVEELSAALLKVVDGGPAGLAMKEKAVSLAQKAKLKRGRDRAAEIVARLAAGSYS